MLKRKKSDRWDSPLRISSLRQSEHMEIDLKSKELYSLHKELQSLFASFGVSDAGSSGRYIKFDGTSESVRKFFNLDAPLLLYWRGDKDRHELISLFSDTICSEDTDCNLLIKLINSVNRSSPEAIELLLKL